MSKGEIIDAGCDYLRFTSPLELKDWQELGIVAGQLQEKQEALGFKVEPWRFKTFTGVKCGKVSWGTSDSHAIIQVSSNPAKECADEIKKRGLRGKCTRADFQTTFKNGELEIDAGNRWEAEIRRDAILKGTGRRFKTAFFKGSDFDTGFTAYSRNTSRYLRYYHAKSGGHKDATDDTYRAEGEFKYAKGPAVWELFCGSEDQAKFAHGLVAAEFFKIGLQEEWMNPLNFVTLQPMPDERSADKSLRYLRETIMPLISRLSEEGHGEELDAMFQLARRGERVVKLLRESQEREALNRKYFPWREPKNASGNPSVQKRRGNVNGQGMEQRLPFEC